MCKTYATHSHVHKATKNVQDTKTKAKAKIKSSNNNEKVKKIKNDDFRLLFACCLCPLRCRRRCRSRCLVPLLSRSQCLLPSGGCGGGDGDCDAHCMYESVCVRERGSNLNDALSSSFVISSISVYYVCVSFGFPYLSMFVFLFLCATFRLDQHIDTAYARSGRGQEGSRLCQREQQQHSQIEQRQQQPEQY